MVGWASAVALVPWPFKMPPEAISVVFVARVSFRRQDREAAGVCHVHSGRKVRQGLVIDLASVIRAPMLMAPPPPEKTFVVGLANVVACDRERAGEVHGGGQTQRRGARLRPDECLDVAAYARGGVGTLAGDGDADVDGMDLSEDVLTGSVRLQIQAAGVNRRTFAHVRQR